EMTGVAAGKEAIDGLLACAVGVAAETEPAGYIDRADFSGAGDSAVRAVVGGDRASDRWPPHGAGRAPQFRRCRDGRGGDLGRAVEVVQDVAEMRRGPAVELR